MFMNRLLNLGVAGALVLGHAYAMPALSYDDYDDLEEEYVEDPLEEVVGSVEDLAVMVIPQENLSEDFVSESRFHSGVCTVGPRGGDITYKCTGFGFRSSFPRNVFCQTRQNRNNNVGWPDQFDCQIIETGLDFVRFRIRRMDDGTGSSGWGQSLRADLLIID